MSLCSLLLAAHALASPLARTASRSALRPTNTLAMSSAGIATRANDELVAEALSCFLGEGAVGCAVTPTSGGVNNMVQYVDAPSGERTVLRIYNNGCNTRRVEFEHAVLAQLDTLGPFSFALPKCASTIINPTILCT
ncbi:hypothetical protein T492DRAFT_845046 [Pavlovales sp. CCMP2436]|nr:hypothetical protein T492DRAFT_845046 [Pavlovales sp. CCMP2436]